MTKPPGLWTRRVDAGWLASLAAARRGLASSSPPQLGQIPLRTVSAHEAQKVHSNEQMRAPGASGGRSLSQHSHPGLSSSMVTSPKCGITKVSGEYSNDSQRQSFHGQGVARCMLTSSSLESFQSNSFCQL
jgi:hypothetical protein